MTKTKQRLWKVRGKSSANRPVELKVRAEDHNDAVRKASRRRVRVQSCVLVDEHSKTELRALAVDASREMFGDEPEIYGLENIGCK